MARWDHFRELRGMDRSATIATDPSLAKTAYNVDLLRGTYGRRRRSCETVSLTSGPASPIYFLGRFTDETGAHHLFAANSDGTPYLHRLSAGTWTNITYSDTVSAVTSSLMHGATLRGKWFFAYPTSTNRLHVYDPDFSTTALRRVGIEASGAATCADGGGAGVATIRYYKIQWKVINGSDTVATSELSAAVSHTPAGAVSVTVTKPTTPDSATHWVVFASTDNVNYFNLSGNIAVGTTTYSDVTTVLANYSNGTVAPTAGLYVPPPAARYIISDGNRLIMAGGYTTLTVTATQTAQATSRVWFTQVIGALDETGEDEAIAQTTDQKNWVDVGESDGDSIVGLIGPVDGLIYVAKERSIWILSPTGLPDAPYRTDRLTDQFGGIGIAHMTVGETADGRACAYIIASQSKVLHQIVGTQIVKCGDDALSVSQTASYDEGLENTMWVVWNQVDRCLDMNDWRWFPAFARMGPDGWRGGWTQRSYPGSVVNHAVMFPLSSRWVLYSGGTGALTTAALCTHSGANPDDLGSNAGFSSYVLSHLWQPHADAMRYATLGPVVVEYDYSNVSADHTVRLRTFAVNSLIPSSITGTTQAALGSGASDGKMIEKMETPLLGDAFEYDWLWTFDTSNTTNQTRRPALYAVHVRVGMEGEL